MKTISLEKYIKLSKFIDRFESKFIKKTPMKCWEWLSTRRPDGYGLITSMYGGPTLKAHRVSYRLYNGIIPKEKLARHKCDNPPCVNPFHLELGNKRDNMLDKIRRSNYKPGWRNTLKTHCKHGHEFTEENTYRYGGHRICRACHNKRKKIYRAKQ